MERRSVSAATTTTGAPLIRISGKIYDGFAEFILAHCAWRNAKDTGEIPVLSFACKFCDTFVKLLEFQQKSLRCLWFKILM